MFSYSDNVLKKIDFPKMPKGSPRIGIDRLPCSIPMDSKYPKYPIDPESGKYFKEFFKPDKDLENSQISKDNTLEDNKNNVNNIEEFIRKYSITGK